MFDHDDNIVIELDINKKIKNANLAAQSFFGAEITALLNKEVMSCCLEKKLPYPNFMRKNIVNKELFEDVDIKNTDSSKPLQYISWRIVPLYFEGNLTGSLLFGKDTTQNKLSERSLKSVETRLELFINAVPGYHWWKDLNGKYLGCNEAVAKLLGLNSVKDVVGKTDYELAWSESADIMTENDRKVIERGEIISGEEVVSTTDNTPLTFFIVKMPLKNDLSEVIGTIGSSIDITDRKKMEKELHQAKIKSEAASNAKTEFIANMSHDIRTPLSGVVGMSKIMEDKTSDPEEKQYAHWVNECGEQLLSLLNGILDVISAENINDSDLLSETFDLRQCLQDIAQLEMPTVKLKNLDLNIDVPDDIPKYLISDRTKLHRIILNLIGNSIKFTQEGHVAIGVKLLERLDSAVRLRFSISDTGIGIPDELQSNVFDRFFRVNPSYKGVYKGHGIGLHIAQSYVELLGGEIKLTSQVNQGTTFYFDLLLNVGSVDNISNKPSNDNMVEVDTPLIEEKSTTILSERSIQTLQSPITNEDAPWLLLIEDNPIALRTIETLVKNAGCRYTSTDNAELAFQLIQSNHFDLILSDIGLPGMSGTELTEATRAWEQSSSRNPMPIVGLTAHTGKDEIARCLQSGMNKVLIKPANLKMIQDLVHDLIINNQAALVPDVSESTTTPDGLGPDLPETEADLFKLDQFPILDIESGVSILGNKDVLIELLTMMLAESIDADKQDMEKAHAQQDWRKVEAIAHKMKGGAAYCGTIKMHRACQYLERYQKAGLSKSLEPLYIQLLAVLVETKISITDWFSQVNNHPDEREIFAQASSEVDNNASRADLSRNIPVASVSCDEHHLPDNDTELFELSQFPLLNIEGAMPYVGTEKTLAKILDSMINETLLHDMQIMETAMNANDWGQVADLAQKIKSEATYVGTTRMKIACQNFERHKEYGDSGLLDLRFQQLRMVIEDTILEVSTWLSSRK